MELPEFRSTELSVRIDECEKELYVEGRRRHHLERIGSTDLQFKRKFVIPDDVRTEAIASYFTRGKLIISAPKLSSQMTKRKIPIQTIEENSDNENTKTAELSAAFIDDSDCEC